VRELTEQRAEKDLTQSEKKQIEKLATKVVLKKVILHAK
jgi:hypothetical protein